MKFCCVTPCLNAEDLIEDTMRSVLQQSIFKEQKHQLHYIIKDGGSTDNTLLLVNKLCDEYRDKTNISVELISEPDHGLYDALTSAFKRLSPGDVYSYINAGDYYSLFAFEIVADIFTKNEVHFLTGLRCLYNDKNHLLRCDPYKYDKKLMIAGVYGTQLPHVQQESTFWRSTLHTKIDYQRLKKIKLAGDFFLWKTFIEYEKLYIVSAHLAGFKIHVDQLSTSRRDEYYLEVCALSESKNLWRMTQAFIHKLLWSFPDRVKIVLSKEIFHYNFGTGEFVLSLERKQKRHL